MTSLWTSLEGAPAPAADGTGPFAGPEFLCLWWDHFAGTGLEAVEIMAGDSLLTLVDDGDVLRFAGHGDLTDYHTPLGTDVSALGRQLATHPRGRAELDSIPTPHAEMLAEGLRGGGADVEVVEHEATAVVDLPGSFEEYLAGLSKKQRHEVRRKRRRYTLMLGEWEHETHRGAGFGFDEFVRLHRSAPGDKGEFMTSEMEKFFADLILGDGWRVDLLRHPEGATATVFGYTDETGYYLYNSSFDADLADASPGWVLVASMIETAISEGIGRFDFLKGDEAYKFRLGADSRQLSRIDATW